MIIFVTFQIAGFHQWSDAPARYSYLANKHRHLFHFRVDIEVGHDNREVEMIEFKHIATEEVLAIYKLGDDGIHTEFGGDSCEMIAKALFNALRSNYAVFRIEVSEDGENGAVLEI